VHTAHIISLYGPTASRDDDGGLYEITAAAECKKNFKIIIIIIIKNSVRRGFREKRKRDDRISFSETLREQ